MFLKETGVESDANGENDYFKFFAEGPRNIGETIQDICKGSFGGSICSSIASISKEASASLGKGSTKFLEENERDGGNILRRKAKASGASAHINKTSKGHGNRSTQKASWPVSFR